MDTYGGVATNHATIDVPEETDIPQAADVAEPAKRLLDIERHTQARATALENQSVGVVAGDRWVPCGLPAPIRNLNARFTPFETHLEQTSVTDAGQLVWNIALPIFAGTLKGGRVYVRGGAGGGNGVRPDLTVALVDPGSFTSIVIATTSDPGSAAAFQAAHVHTTTTANGSFSGPRFARVTLTGESGGLAVVGYSVRGIDLLIGPP